MHLTLDKKAVAHSFSRAAAFYDKFAQLQRDIGHQLLLDIYETDNNRNILDLGCGTGYFSEQLLSKSINGQITCLDISSAMLEQVLNKKISRLHCIQSDIDYLPFNHHVFDLIYSNLVLQWSADLPSCLSQIKKSLHKAGKLYFSTLTQGSLYELTEAWKQVDNHPHTNKFISLSSLISVLKKTGFSEFNVKTQTYTLEYHSVIDIMRALKGVGANHVHGQQPSSSTGKHLISLLEKGYRPFINERGKYNLTYQVCYIEAEK